DLIVFEIKNAANGKNIEEVRITNFYWNGKPDGMGANRCVNAKPGDLYPEYRNPLRGKQWESGPIDPGGSDLIYAVVRKAEKYSGCYKYDVLVYWSENGTAKKERLDPRLEVDDDSHLEKILDPGR
ncbi:MAG: hypothetical protein ACE5JI_13895, partial [Acidobacteriota bacterium]